jgi:DNA-binding transcriptional MerR regulator/methylmalonyl-CoA mutase cobalamin-binding subunit
MTEELYTIQDLAGALGVSTSTLRAWERRYGLLMPQRSQGGHRLYSDADKRLYLYIHHLKEKGAELGQIAKRGREALLAESSAYFAALCSTEGESKYEFQITERVISALRARQYDQAIEAIERAASVASSATEFANVSLAVMDEVGRAWQRGQVSVSVEHLITARVRYLLAEKFYSAPVSGSCKGHVVCAGLPDNHHELGLLRVAVFLKSWGYGVLYLGPNTPVPDLSAFVQEVNPTFVCLSSTSATSTKKVTSQLERINSELANKVPVIIGGAGIQNLDAKHLTLNRLYLTQILDELQQLADRFSRKNKVNSAPSGV